MQRTWLKNSTKRAQTSPNKESYYKSWRYLWISFLENSFRKIYEWPEPIDKALPTELKLHWLMFCVPGKSHLKRGVVLWTFYFWTFATHNADTGTIFPINDSLTTMLTFSITWLAFGTIFIFAVISGAIFVHINYTCKTLFEDKGLEVQTQ